MTLVVNEEVLQVLHSCPAQLNAIQGGLVNVDFAAEDCLHFQVISLILYNRCPAYLDPRKRCYRGYLHNQKGNGIGPKSPRWHL